MISATSTHIRGIPFSSELIPPIERDEKTVTRRIINPQPEPDGNGNWIWRGGKALLRATYGADYVHTDECALRRALQKCAPYQVGDLAYVKETWAILSNDTGTVSIAYKARLPEGKTLAETDGGVNVYHVGREAWAWADQRKAERWRSGRFMPRWAARIWLEVVSVRPERLQEISYRDVIAEGFREFLTDEQQTDAAHIAEAKRAFTGTWDRLHTKDGHGSASDPWVWRIEFRRTYRRND